MKFMMIEQMGSEYGYVIRTSDVEAKDEEEAISHMVESLLDRDMDLRRSILLIPAERTVELIPLIKAAQKKIKDQESKS